MFLLLVFCIYRGLEVDLGKIYHFYVEPNGDDVEKRETQAMQAMDNEYWRLDDDDNDGYYDDQDGLDYNDLQRDMIKKLRYN